MSKSAIISTMLISMGAFLWGQNVGIGTAAPVSGALLHLEDPNRGFLPPRVSLWQANSWWPLVGSPTDGMLVYNTATSGSNENAVYPGYYYWRSGRWRRFTDNGYAGMIKGVLYSGTQNLSSACYTYQYLNSYIDLPPGKWIVFSTQLISPTTLGSGNNNPEYIWVRTYLSDSYTCSSPSADILGSFLMSGLLPKSTFYGLVNGQVLIHNNGSTTKRYYYCGCKEGYNYTANLLNFSTTSWGENQLFALPAE